MSSTEPAALHHGWNLSIAEAREVQLRLREQLVLQAPPNFAPRTVAGADISTEKHAHEGFAGIVVLDAATLAPVGEATAVAHLPMPYVPGYLSFRELPALALAWERLGEKPEVLVFDGQGLAHPRRFGVACHGGVLFGIPTIGCGKSILIGKHGELGPERGATAELVDKGEVVGMAVRTRAGCKPVYVSPGHLMDLGTAVRIVLAASPRFREPETTRQAHRLVNRLRRAASPEAQPTDARPPQDDPV
ncbi:MAG TPA: deoxyribonuclease V [Longimicrobiaceae bacterium]|jgi:deoxyribonuclease V|nr:deoxyribonuclease V [Longimicrobiaceae bacterium]